MTNRLAVNARDQTDRRIGAQGDEGDVWQKEYVEQHAEDVECVDVQYIEKRSWP